MSERKVKANEIQITRVYEAPVKMVWDAWTDSEQVAKWWGPRGFSITHLEKDLRPGGFWRYIMHGPDGTNYPNKTVYHEVEKYSRLVYDHGGSDDRPPMFKVTVTFSEHQGKTTMQMTMALESEEAAKKTKKFIKEVGGNSTWDRLAEYLSTEDKFVINRSFDAPIETLFKMWTDPKHVSQWTTPKGSTMEYIAVDIREGGEAFYSMLDQLGNRIFGKAKYLKIVAPELLVYTQCFSDENGNIVKPSFAPTWPTAMLTTVMFSSEGPNQTRVTLEWSVYGEANEVERKTFHDAKGGMTQGWTGSLDKLDDYLEDMAKMPKR